jgi:hypothetical protein
MKVEEEEVPDTVDVSGKESKVLGRWIQDPRADRDLASRVLNPPPQHLALLPRDIHRVWHFLLLHLHLPPSSRPPSLICNTSSV